MAIGSILAALWYGTLRMPSARWLPDYGPVPPFRLVDQQQHAVTNAHLTGSVWVADFIFTRCAGQCPLMSGRMAQLQAAFRDEPRVRLVSLSVDPARDTPQVLADYASAYQADPARWHFLTGDIEAVRRLSQDGFHLGLSEGGTAAEPILHSVKLVLVDPQGSIRGYYDSTDAKALRQLQADARQLARRGSNGRR